MGCACNIQGSSAVTDRDPPRRKTLGTRKSNCALLRYSIFELSVNTTSGAPSFVRSLRKGRETPGVPGGMREKETPGQNWGGPGGAPRPPLGNRATGGE